MFGGTVAKRTASGAEVNYLVVTNGASGGADLSVSDVELTATWTEEQRAAARVAGVSRVTFLGYYNDELQVTVELKRDIVRQIRRTRLDPALTMTPYGAPKLQSAGHAPITSPSGRHRCNLSIPTR